MKQRILVAEDNAPLAAMLQKFLERSGFDTVVATDGEEALALALEKTFDLAVLDLRLPKVHGADILKRLRADVHRKNLPIILMTGVYRGEKYAAGARRLGISGYLEKPFRPEDFLAAVRNALPAPRGGWELAAEAFLTGTSLSLTADGLPPVIFIRGVPVSFDSRGRREFVSFLVSRGRISTGDADFFVASGNERLFLTQAGLLTLEELAEESRLFLGRLVAEILSSRRPTAVAAEAVPELPLVQVQLPRLLYEAAKAAPPALPAGAEGRYPARTPLFFRHSNLFVMTPEDIDVLDRIDGRRTVAEIAAPTTGDARPFLSFLLRSGMVELRESPGPEAVSDGSVRNLFNRPIADEPTLLEEHAVDFDDLVQELSGSVEIAVGDGGMAAPLTHCEIGFEQTVMRDHAFVQGKNYYEIFGLTRQNFSFEALKDAYFGKTKQYTPDRFMELSGTTAEMAEEVLALFANAYNTLSSVVAKERYDELLHSDRVGLDGKKDERLQASIQLESGKVFLEMGEFDNAEKALQDAYTLMDDNAAICAYLAWAIYRNPANRNSRSAQDKARNLLNRSLQIEKTADAYAFRGWILLDEGRDGLAEGEFQKALKLNPHDGDARRGMRTIGEKREADKKGIFRKIFG